MHRGSCSVTLTTILWLWSLRLAVNNWCLRLRHTVRRNPRGIGAEYWPQEQPCNQIPPQHLWRGYPIDQWVSECVWMCVCVCVCKGSNVTVFLWTRLLTLLAALRRAVTGDGVKPPPTKHGYYHCDFSLCLSAWSLLRRLSGGELSITEIQENKLEVIGRQSEDREEWVITRRY